MALHYLPMKPTFLILTFKALCNLFQNLPFQTYFPLLLCPFAQPVITPSGSHDRHHTFPSQEPLHVFLTSFFFCFQLPVFSRPRLDTTLFQLKGRLSGSISLGTYILLVGDSPVSKLVYKVSCPRNSFYPCRFSNLI